MTGRTLLAALHLLDRQLVDRHDRLAGKVDDVELRVHEETGQLVVTALWSGRGTLWRRFGAEGLAAWIRRIPPADTGGDPGLAGGRIPMARVADIGPVIKLAADADELATHAGERWVRRHVISHVPGHRDAPQ
jgi:hypothetical protein